MWLFNRRKKELNTLPPEVQAFSQAAHRERIGMAWLVGLVSLVVSLALLAGLFFGGRWAYRKIAHKGSTSTPISTSGQNSKGKKGVTEDNGKATQTPSSTSDGNQNASTPTTTTPQTTTVPNTGDQQTPAATSLPNTGSDD